MIVGRNFVWLHFPKSGGHAVDQALKAALSDDGEAAFDPPDHPGWHDSLSDRQSRDRSFDPNGRTVLSGFRRLPHWILSRVHYEAARPPYLTATREMLVRGEFFHRNGQVGKADHYITQYDAERVSRWVRTEHLATDFLDHFGDLLGPNVAGKAMRKVRRIVNGAQLNYIRDLGFYFTPDELQELYAANPLWTDLEHKLYGKLLTVDDRSQELWYFLDRNLRFVAVSRAALDDWSMTLDEVLGRELLSVFPMIRGTTQYDGHLRALKARRPIEVDTISRLRSEPVHVHYTPKSSGVAVSYRFVVDQQT